MSKRKKVLITGASGFIGHCLVEGLKERGYEIYAGARKSSDTCELSRMGVRITILNMDRAEVLRDELRCWKSEIGAWDFVIHTAGVTKCRREADFERVNYCNTRNLLDALREENMVPEKFIFLSSLSVYGPIHEHDKRSITDRDLPCPNTAYGRSKLKAEEYLASLDDVPYVILRPTGVYGPREKDYFMMAQSICRHVDFSVGFRRQTITFVYVKDVVQAVWRSMESPVKNKGFFLSDGKEYASRDFSDLLQKELKVKHVCHFRVPLWMLRVVSFLSQHLSSWVGRSSTLNLDKYKIMKQRNWRCDITPAREELGYAPHYDLACGVEETINWYKKEKWL